MDVVFKLSNLLFVHDRVVVYGLGIFTTEIEKAYVHPVEHSFTPEFKKIKFQANKSVNDSLLIDVIGDPNAENIIADFVSKVQKGLKEGNRVQLKNIGYLYTHHTGEIILEQDRTFNYVKKNFGLQGFVQEPVNKVVATESSTISAANPVEKKKSRVGLYILWAAAIVLVIIAVWKYEHISTLFEKDIVVENIPTPKSNIIDSKSSLVTNDSNDTIEKQIRAEDTTAINEKENSTEPTEVNTMETSSKVIEKEEAPVEVIKQQGTVYYVIAGCFRSEYKADRLLVELKKEGFGQASIEGKTPTGLIRVCYASYPKRRQASNYMLKLQNQGRKGVWIQKGE